MKKDDDTAAVAWIVHNVDTPRPGKVYRPEAVPLYPKGGWLATFRCLKEEGSCCISSEHKKTSDLNFIPESPYQNPEEDK